LADPTILEQEEWFTRVYLENYKLLYRFGEILIRRFCKPMLPDLEELVEETYEVLLRKCSEVYSHENISAWLIVTLKYNFSNRRRKIYRRLRSERLVDIATQQNIPDDIDFVEDILRLKDSDVEDLLKQIIRDEDKYRAFVDFQLHHVPIRELAARYGKKEGTMRVQLYRTRLLCKAYFEQNNIIFCILLAIYVTFSNLKT